MLRPLRDPVPGVLVLLVLAACSGSSPTDSPPRAPTITIDGVEDGGVYQEPRTIGIAVDRGSFHATLDGELFTSGATVSAPGDHTLRVDASHQGRTSSREVRFRIDLTGESVLILRMFDLGDNDAGGGGDAILLTDSSSTAMIHFLIDAGPEGTGGSNRRFVADRLTGLGVDSLLGMLLTHAHTDHFRGMPDVLDEVHVRTFWYNGQERSFQEYRTLIDRARSRAEEVVVPEAVETVPLGAGSTLRVVPPLSTHLDDASAGSSELNEGSLGTALESGGIRFFFTGDGEVEANRRWRTSFPDLTEAVDVLKAGHHGANDAVFDDGFSGASTWLEHTDPAITLITANGRSHPRQRALQALMERSADRVYCTPVHGDVELRVSPSGQIEVTVERNANADCEPGSEATT